MRHANKTPWDVKASEIIAKVVRFLESAVDIFVKSTLGLLKFFAKMFQGLLRIGGDRTTFAFVSIAGFVGGLILTALQWYEMGGILHGLALKALASGSLYGAVRPTLNGAIVGMVAGGYINYTQLQPRVWRYAKQWAYWKKQQGTDTQYQLDEETLTPEEFLNQESNIAYARNNRTSALFYRVELLCVVLYSLIVGFLGVFPPVFTAWAIIRGLLALRLPEMALSDVFAKLADLFPSRVNDGHQAGSTIDI